MKSSAWRWSVLTVATALTLTACAQGTTGNNTNDDGNEGDNGSDAGAFDPDAELSGNVQIMGFGAGDEIATVRYEAAQDAMPDVSFSLVEGDLDIQQFLSAVAAGDAPGLIYANRDQIGTFASRGAIVPLDACIAGEGIDTSVFREAAVDQVTFNDAMYGIPEFNSVQVTMANADLLSAAGLTIDDVNGSDWDAIQGAAEKLMVTDGGLSVIGYDTKLPEFLPLWANSNGVKLLSDDGRTANLNDPAVVEALEFAVSIYDLQGGFSAVKAYRDSADFFGSGNQFATNVLGAMSMEQWYINVLNEVSPDAPMAFDTYRGKDGQTMAYASGSAWAVPANTEATQAAACRLMKVMTATDTWVAAAEERVRLRAETGQLFTGVLTGNREADDAIREMIPTDAPEPWASAINAMYEANDNTFSFPANPADAEFKTAWQDAVNRVLNGQAEPKASLDQAQDEAQSALDERWADWDDEQD